MAQTRCWTPALLTRVSSEVEPAEETLYGTAVGDIQQHGFGAESLFPERGSFTVCSFHIDIGEHDPRAGAPKACGTRQRQSLRDPCDDCPFPSSMRPN